ncbi:hypothetical protein ACFQZE_12805 [Paenibacillus sp. GCM10027627]
MGACHTFRELRDGATQSKRKFETRLGAELQESRIHRWTMNAGVRCYG